MRRNLRMYINGRKHRTCGVCSKEESLYEMKRYLNIAELKSILSNKKGSNQVWFCETIRNHSGTRKLRNCSSLDNLLYLYNGKFYLLPSFDDVLKVNTHKNLISSYDVVQGETVDEIYDSFKKYFPDKEDPLLNIIIPNKIN